MRFDVVEAVWILVGLWRKGVLNAHDGAVVGVLWPLPSNLGSRPLSTLSSHTPMTDMIKGQGWLVCVSLMSSFRLPCIHVPPPMSTKCYLNIIKAFCCSCATL